MRESFVASSSLLWVAALMALAPTAAYPASIVAAAETTPVPSPSDAADDPAIWIHPIDPSLSVLIGTDKKAGIAVYDLAGSEQQFRSDGELNNVDVRYGFPFDGGSIDIAAASNRSDDTISLYEIDPATGLLDPIAAAGGIQTGIEVYGFCLYASPGGAFHALVNSKDGDVEQWELFDDGAGAVAGALVRSFAVGGQTEGCVADDVHANLYIGEEEVGIWQYGAEPGDGVARTQVDTTGAGGHLSADVEGLALFYLDSQAGYLLASSQGDSSFSIYDRQTSAFLGNFTIDAGVIDAVSETDGIDVTNVSLGIGLESGLFVAQDGMNQGGRQNYKLVPWDDIALAFAPPLETASTWDPRAPVAVPALPLLARAVLALGLIGGSMLRRTARSPAAIPPPPGSRPRTGATRAASRERPDS